MNTSLLWEPENTVSSQCQREWELSDDIAARIVTLMGNMTAEELAERTGKDITVINRILGGGVNLTLHTIALLEEALGNKIIDVHN